MVDRVFTRYQKDYLKQLIIECEVQRLSIRESLEYIHTKIGIDISERHFCRMKKAIKESYVKQIAHLREHRTAFQEQFYRRIKEIEILQKENWDLYKDTRQQSCLHELHLLSITLADLLELLPVITGQSLVQYEENIPAYEKMVTDT